MVRKSSPACHTPPMDGIVFSGFVVANFPAGRVVGALEIGAGLVEGCVEIGAGLVEGSVDWAMDSMHNAGITINSAKTNRDISTLPIELLAKASFRVA